ncbi:hypothetical protein GL325_02140 [Aeromicrobium sp. 636]|uniref:Helix-turn-helix domain-containing protein n=1 Tax=Aeromicrobium senzhongii TaxID=2663859 RepID=A0A8I0ETH8_9ACTN|nr:MULTISPECIES: helix-turn-helix domain-containing protein [Aeromicrobium]MBC9225116.1 helix-turn-helix domain-containing protein [Aeromicrobium senzhongii]MCQ3997226.1 hypothetical protein [Aeromicrobium sp. 636]
MTSGRIQAISDVAAALLSAEVEIGSAFARQWWRDNQDTGELESETHSARDVVQRCAHSLMADVIADVDISDLSGPGQRFAEAGLSATTVLDWFRGLESTITDFVLGLDEIDLHIVRQTHSRVSAFFDASSSSELQNFENTFDELGTWYSAVANDMVAYLTSGAAVDEGSVNRQSRKLGLDPRLPYRAIAIRADSGISAHRWALIRHRLVTVVTRLNSQPNPLVQERKGLLLALISPATSNAELVQMLESLLDDPELKRTLYVGTGETVDCLADAGRSCRQALSALEIGMFREQQGKVTQCTDVILEVLLTHNHWVSHRLIDSRLGPLVGKPNIIETLRAYIDCNMSLQRTAEEIFVHPNTVAYRLRQITKLTGRDMRNVSDLADLSVALAALDVIKMYGNTGAESTNLHSAILAGADARID